MFAHPDDEILGQGGTLARYASEGVQVELVCATRGEAGEIADPALATPETLGGVRESELLCAARTLGVNRVTFLDFRDSGMAGSVDNHHPEAFMNAAAELVVPRLVQLIRQSRPDIIITFEPNGGYGHPDHIAINRHTKDAFAAAAEAGYHPDLGLPWQTARLFYGILPSSHFIEMKQRMLARGMDVSFFDELEKRRQGSWPEEHIDCIIDVSGSIELKWTALLCHRTQFGQNALLRRLPEEDMKQIFSTECFALASPEPAARLKLTGLFDGLGAKVTG
jgi:LmbE family N-acetylglucosaminyl deacetylase